MEFIVGYVTSSDSEIEDGSTVDTSAFVVDADVLIAENFG